MIGFLIRSLTQNSTVMTNSFPNYHDPAVRLNKTATPPMQQLKTGNNVPFEIQTINWMRENKWKDDLVPQRHNYYMIIWVKEGSGTHLIDLEKFEITNKTIYCLRPGQIHLFRPTENTDGYVISFNSEFLCLHENNFDLLLNTGLFNTFSHSPAFSVHEEMERELDHAALKMKQEFDNMFLLRSEILRVFLKIFLIHLTRQYENLSYKTTQSKNVELAKKFHSLLEKNFTKKKMVTDYAEELIVTPNYLNEIVKKVSGFPASHHIQQRIVLEAKRQAVYADLSMKEIAYDLGFDDIAHFSKFFKNVSGRSYTNFKKEISGQLAY